MSELTENPASTEPIRRQLSRANDVFQVPVLRMLGVAFQGSQWGYAATLSTAMSLITVVLTIVVVFIKRGDKADVKSL